MTRRAMGWAGPQTLLAAALLAAAPAAWAQEAAEGPDRADPGSAERNPGVEVAAPADLAIVPVPELSEGLVPTSALRLLDRSAIEDPFVPPELRLGGFLLRSTVEVGPLATTNEDGGLDEEFAVAPLLSPGLVASSDWERHQAGFELRGSTAHFGEGDTNENQILATAAGRLDLAPGATLGGTLDYNFISEGLAEEIAPVGAARPGVQDVRASVLFTGRGERFGVQARVGALRTFYDFGDGVGDAVTAEYDATVRASVAATTRVAPFAEAFAGRVVDVSDDRRPGGRLDGLYAGARLGAVLDFGPGVTGEVALGARRDMFGDVGGLETTRPTLDATLIWSLAEQTNLRLAAGSDVDASGLEGAFARAIQVGTLAVESRARDDLRLVAGLGIASVDYGAIPRDDVTTSVFLSADRDLNAFAAVVARYAFEETRSTAPDAGQREHRFALLLRLRR